MPEPSRAPRLAEVLALLGAEHLEDDPLVIRGALFYGPPRSLRGKLANLIRRLLGHDQEDELYGSLPGLPEYLTPHPEADWITIRFTAAGTFEVWPEPREETIQIEVEEDRVDAQIKEESDHGETTTPD